MTVKINIVLTNKWLYCFLVIGVLLILGGVYALNSGDFETMGHSADEIEGICEWKLSHSNASAGTAIQGFTLLDSQQKPWISNAEAEIATGICICTDKTNVDDALADKLAVWGGYLENNAWRTASSEYGPLAGYFWICDNDEGPDGPTGCMREYFIYYTCA